MFRGIIAVVAVLAVCVWAADSELVNEQQEQTVLLSTHQAITGPQQVHLSYTADPTEMHVTYVTRNNQGTPIDPVVQYGTTTKMQQLQTGYSYTYTSDNWLGMIHSITIKNLPVATQYYYQVQDPYTQTWSEMFTFMSAPATPQHGPLRIGLTADLGSECDYFGCGNQTIARLNALATQGKIDFVIHAGDIAYTSGNETIYDQFFNQVQPMASAVPYMVCAGNHEAPNNFTGYNNRFNMPGRFSSDDSNNFWHSYDVAGVHFIAIATEQDYTNTSHQIAWLTQDLQAARSRNVDWIVAYGHRPLYCTTNDYYDCEIGGPINLRPNFEPLFKQYGVDVYLAGHLHNYERFYPVYNGTLVTKSYDNPGATTHLIIGQAGDREGLTNTWEARPDYSAFRNGTHTGYAVMTVESSSEMRIDTYASDTQEIIDTVTLTK